MRLFVICWLSVLSLGILGCDAPSTKTTSVPEKLKIHRAGCLVEDADSIFVLCHGFGAPGTDLIPLAEQLDETGRVAFLFPEGPIALDQGGRAWNRLGGDGFEHSRSLVANLLTQLSTEHPDCPLIIGGFSQGATLSANLLDTSRCPTLRAAVLFSPANILRYPPPKNQNHPQVLISHGRNDTVLTYSNAEDLKNKLEASNVSVTWAPFDGGHTIAREGLLATRQLLESLTIDNPQ